MHRLTTLAGALDRIERKRTPTADSVSPVARKARALLLIHNCMRKAEQNLPLANNEHRALVLLHNAMEPLA